MFYKCKECEAEFGDEIHMKFCPDCSKEVTQIEEQTTPNSIEKHSGSYKCVPAPITITITEQEDYYTACNVFEEIINEETKCGWKYVGMEQVSTHKTVGCLAYLFGARAETSTFNMIIFKKV